MKLLRYYVLPNNVGGESVVDNGRGPGLEGHSPSHDVHEEILFRPRFRGCLPFIRMPAADEDDLINNGREFSGPGVLRFEACTPKGVEKG